MVEQECDESEVQRLQDMFNKTKEEARSQEFDTLQDGENIIDLKEFIELSVKEFIYTSNDKEVKRKKLVVIRKGSEDKPLYLPISIHDTLLEFIGKKHTKVNIIKSGEGLKTKYTVIPA